MRTLMLPVVLVSCLLAAFSPAAHAARKKNARAEGYKEIPAFNWNLAASGFSELFKLRNKEIESAEAGRYFPGVVAFALGRMDDTGHFLMLKCGASVNCDAKRDSLEDRLVHATLLDVVRTPRAKKSQLYNERTWELTPLGERYVDILRKRYPDLSTRLGRLILGSFDGR